MQMVPQEMALALTAVLGRLGQVRNLWHQALDAYFDPTRFLIAVQNCITTCRTVTFILQSHKAAIADFDSWYSTYQQRCRADPIMEWAKNARNKIEKQGDLETLSQVRAELIAAYAGNPVTDWMPLEVGWSSEHLRRSIPARLLDPHVIENGVLAIERRWVDVELPNYEVLDGLAYVYGQLALMIVSLHEHLGVEIPEVRAELGEPLLRNLLPDGRLPSMDRPLEDRAVYVAVKDGSVLGYRREFIRSDDLGLIKKAKKRYGENRSGPRLKNATTLLEVAQIHFERARSIMARDGHHASMFIPLRGAIPIDLIIAAPQNRADKYMLMRDVARYVRRIGADGLIQVAEAWTANRDAVPHGRFAVDARNRGEALVLWAVNAQGEQISLAAAIERKKIKRHKVKRLLPTEIEEGRRLVAMAPVLEVWGMLDVLGLNEKNDDWDWVENHFKPLALTT